MSQPVDPEEAYLRYMRGKTGALNPTPEQFGVVKPEAPKTPEGALPEANVAADPKSPGRVQADLFLRRLMRLPPSSPAPQSSSSLPAPAVAPTPPAPVPVTPEPPGSAPEEREASAPAPVELPALPEKTPEAPRGPIGRLWDGMWRFLSLTGEEVFGEDTLDRPETPEEATKREAAGKAELRRLLGTIPETERREMLDTAVSIEDLGQKALAYELARRTGKRPDDAVPFLSARQGLGVDVAEIHASLVDSAFRQLRLEHPGQLSPPALEELRERATKKADKDLAGILVLPTGLPMVVRDVDEWKKRLMDYPLPIRIPLAIYTTPTDIVYRGTVSHRSASKWSPLDVFGRMTQSTPIGAAIEMVPPEDVFPMFFRSMQEAAGDMPLFSGPVGWALRAVVPDPEGPTYQELVRSPEMVDRLIEGSDLATATGQIGLAIAHELENTPLGGLAKRHPMATGLMVALPAMLLEPSVLDLMIAPVGVAADAAKGLGLVGDAVSGVSKPKNLAQGLREVADMSERAGPAGDIAAEIERLREIDPAVESIVATTMLGEMEKDPALRLQVLDAIRKAQEEAAKIPELEKKLAEAKTRTEQAKYQADLAAQQAVSAFAMRQVWEAVTEAEIKRAAAQKTVIEAEKVERYRVKAAGDVTAAEKAYAEAKVVPAFDDEQKVVAAAKAKVAAAEAAKKAAVEAAVQGRKAAPAKAADVEQAVAAAPPTPAAATSATTPGRLAELQTEYKELLDATTAAKERISAVKKEITEAEQLRDKAKAARKTLLDDLTKLQRTLIKLVEPTQAAKNSIKKVIGEIGASKIKSYGATRRTVMRKLSERAGEAGQDALEELDRIHAGISEVDGWEAAASRVLDGEPMRVLPELVEKYGQQRGQIAKLSKEISAEKKVAAKPPKPPKPAKALKGDKVKGDKAAKPDLTAHNDAIKAARAELREAEKALNEAKKAQVRRFKKATVELERAKAGSATAQRMKPRKLSGGDVRAALEAFPAAKARFEAATAKLNATAQAKSNLTKSGKVSKKAQRTWEAAQQEYKLASDEYHRLRRIKQYHDTIVHVIPATKVLRRTRAAEMYKSVGRAKKEYKYVAKLRKRVVKAEDRLEAAEDAASVPARLADIRRRVLRMYASSLDAVARVADVPDYNRGVGLTGRQYMNVPGRLKFKPSLFGVSTTTFRDARPASELLDDALEYADEAALAKGEPSAVLDPMEWARGLIEKYGREIFDAWRTYVRDPVQQDLLRKVFPSPRSGAVAWPKIALSADELRTIRHMAETADAFAELELKASEGLLPGLALLRQVEAAPVRFYGNAFTSTVRSVVWWARRYLSPNDSRYGAISEHLPGVERAFDYGKDTASSDVREMATISDATARMRAYFDYVDKPVGVKTPRGSTLGNATTGRSLWHETLDYIEMRRAMFVAAKRGDLQGVVEDAVQNAREFEDFLYQDEGFKGLANMFAARYSDTPAPVQGPELVRLAWHAAQKSSSFEEFAERFARAQAGVLKLPADERERAIVHGLLSVEHMARLKKAMTQTTAAFGGQLTIPEAKALNALFKRDTGGVTDYDFDLAMRALEKVGMTFLRDTRARGFFRLASREIVESSKRLVAVGADDRNVHFLPKMLIDDLAAKIDNAAKELQPIAERKGNPLGGGLNTLWSAWKRSVTVGFLLPKARYTLAGVAIGDISQVFGWNGPGAALSLARHTLATHLPGYGRVMALASRTLEKSGAPGAKWLGSKLDAMTSPLLNAIFLGRTGSVRVGERVYSLDELRTMLRDDGILESVTHEELLRDVDHLHRNVGIKSWISWWQHEIEAHAEMTQVRLRSMYYLQLLARGMDRKTAAKETLDALYNWKHGFAEWESASLLKLNVPFYRFFKLAFRQALQVQLEPFTRATDPNFWMEAVKGRTKLARYQDIAFLQSAIPDWAAQAAAYDENTGEFDEFKMLALMMSGRDDWSTGRWTYGSPLDPRERVYARDAFNKRGAFEMAVMPDLTPLVSMGWWLNFHGTLATVMGWAAAPEVMGPRYNLAGHLWDKNFVDFTGPLGEMFQESGVPWSGKRVTVTPGEAYVGEQLDKVPMMPVSFDPKYARDAGAGIKADATGVFMLRMVPTLLQIPDHFTAMHNTRFEQGWMEGVEGALLHTLGLRRLYTRDPAYEREREIRRVMSALQREVEVEDERAGTPLRGSAFDRYDPIP